MSLATCATPAFPGLGYVVPTDVLYNGIEENLVIIPDRTNCLGLLAEGTRTNLKYRWLLPWYWGLRFCLQDWSSLVMTQGPRLFPKKRSKVSFEGFMARWGRQLSRSRTLVGRRLSLMFTALTFLSFFRFGPGVLRPLAICSCKTATICSTRSG